MSDSTVHELTDGLHPFHVRQLHQILDAACVDPARLSTQGRRILRWLAGWAGRPTAWSRSSPLHARPPRSPRTRSRSTRRSRLSAGRGRRWKPPLPATTSGRSAALTVVDLAHSNGQDLTDAEARRAAEDMVRHADTTGQKVTGDDLGRRFGRTDRWGRKRIERARAVPSTGTPPVRRPRDENAARNGATAATQRRTGTVVRHQTNGRPAPAGDPARLRPSWLDVAAMLVVALVAAAASYGHMFEVAMMAGENLWIARLFPITVDGLVLIALRHRSREARWWLALGIAVSIAANVAAAHPTLQGRLVAAWPPLALLGAHRLIARRTPA